MSIEFRKWLLEATKEDFFALADLQRDRPEHAMLAVQRAMGGGVLNPVVEHIGDLIHRMTERPTFSFAGYDYVKNKVEKVHRWLTNPYGFGKEMEENIQNNATYYKTSPAELRTKVYQALEVYAQEHERLPTYNEAHKLAQLAAVSVGRRQFHKAVGYLEQLQKYLTSQEQWVQFAHQNLTPSVGYPLQPDPSRPAHQI